MSFGFYVMAVCKNIVKHARLASILSALLATVLLSLSFAQSTNNGLLIDVMDRHLRELAGNNAKNCGRVNIGQDPTQATECSLKAFSAKKAFLVRYDAQGIDSVGAVGFATVNSKKVFAVIYDSLGWESHGLPRNARLSDGNHLITEPCSTPVKLWQSKDGRLSCTSPRPVAELN